MAAVLADGVTIIDLCTMLVQMGARVDGIGSPTLEVTGVDELHGTEHVTVSDRVVAGTWAFGAVATQGDVTIRNADGAHLSMALDTLSRAGADITTLPNGFRVVMDGRPKAVDVSTLPYPGF